MSAVRHVISPRRSAVAVDSRPPPATLADTDGIVIATVSRHQEAAPGGSGDVPLTVVRIRGEIDQDTVALLDTILASVIDRNGRVCCDLSEVEFLSAAGLNAMLAAQRHAGTLDCSFHLRGAHGITLRVLQITGLDHLLLIAD